MLTVFGIPNCTSITKARAWLDARGVDYRFHDYKKAGVERATLERWADAAGWEALLNRAGTTWRKLGEADRADVDRDRAIALMMAHPSLIKRPVVEGVVEGMVEGGGVLLIGFKPDRYAQTFPSHAG